MPDTDPDDQAAALDAIFAALAHRARREILVRLGRGPATVSALAAPLAMSAPAVSRHLKVLETAGLITRAIDGRVHTCSFDPAAVQRAVAWMQRNDLFWTGAFDRLAQLIAADDPAPETTPDAAASPRSPSQTHDE